jgi:hypothetical protein
VLKLDESSEEDLPALRQALVMFARKNIKRKIRKTMMPKGESFRG